MTDQAAGGTISLGTRARLSSIGFPREGGARDLLIDALKGYAILLVVFGHCLELADAGVVVPNISMRHNLFYLIYAFHMPLFIFLSGYIMFGRSVRVRRSFVRLIVPFFTWQIVKFVVTVNVWSRFADYMWKSVYGMENALWFLWVLFICYLMLIPVQYVGKKWKWRYSEEVGFLAMFLLINLLQVHTIFGLSFDHFGLPQTRYFFAFFAIGYLVKKYALSLERISRPARVYILAAAVGLYFLLLAWAYWNVDVISSVSIADVVNKPAFFATRYALPLLGILASFALIKVVQALKLHKVMSALSWLGLATLDLYASHGLLMLVSFGVGWLKVMTGFVDAMVLGLALSYVVLRNWRPLSYAFLGRSYKEGPRYRLWLRPKPSPPSTVEPALGPSAAEEL